MLLSICSIKHKYAKFLHKPQCLLEQHTSRQSKQEYIFIYLASISVFLISNGLYLTTMYDESNDYNTLSMISCSLQYEELKTDNILYA